MGISTLYSNKVKTALACRTSVLNDSLGYEPSTVKCDSLRKRSNEHGDIVVSKIVQEQKRLSDEEARELVALYKTGKSTYLLAKQFGCKRTTVSKILKKHGIEVNNRKAQNLLDTNDVITMYQNMHTAQAIADKYGVGSSSIIRCLREHGVKIRGRWG